MCIPPRAAPFGTWHLARGVSTSLFSAELAAFAQAVGASPAKQIVLVLDRAGWHASYQVQVPEHVHLLFLPPRSPEVQPCEHLWQAGDPAANIAEASGAFMPLPEEYLRHMMAAHPERRSFFE